MNILEEAIQTRRKIHSRPEEGWTEFETSYLVSERLKSLGWQVYIGLDALVPEEVLGRNPELVEKAIQRAAKQGVPAAFLESTQGYTGVVGTFDTGRQGPRTAFRFDMDCVQVQETSDANHVPVKEGFASQIPGMMHACGHDGHTAVGLALARWIVENKEDLCGSFVFIFQPAEEGTRGAGPIAAKGWVDDVNFFFAGHCGMYCQQGQLGIGAKGFFATSKLDVSFTGIPSHAGAYPERGRSALTAACSAVMMMQGISRNSEGDTRVSIGKLNAGEGRNVTPVHAAIQLETRGETEEVNNFLVKNVTNIVRGAAEAYEVKYEIKLVGHATTLTTTPKGVELLKRAAETVEGYKTVDIYNSIGGSEDVSLLFKRAVEHGAHGAFFMWGVNNKGHHRADFDLQDVNTMPPAIQLCQNLVRQTNGITNN